MAKEPIDPAVRLNKSWLEVTGRMLEVENRALSGLSEVLHKIRGG